MQHTATEDLSWYVVEAREGAVDKARLSLAVAGLTIWAPVDVRRAPNRGRSSQPRRDIRIPRFGRYLFIRCAMTPSLTLAIDNAGGVAGLLRAGGSDQPAPIPEAQIKALQTAPTAATDGLPQFGRGDTVKITEGPFTGLAGRVADVDRRGVIRVDLEIFGRPTPIIFPAGHVEITQLAKSRAISSFKTRAGYSRAGAAA